MNVLYVSAEAFPFVKTGGLADVAGSLPLELKRLGVDIRVVLPKYSSIEDKYKSQMNYLGYYYVDLDWRHQYVGVYSLEYKATTFYFLDNEYYFNRSSIYGQGDDGERFSFFSKAVVQLMKYINFKAEVVHSNDWHCALVPILCKDFVKGDSFYSGIRQVFTIHNLKYQGVFDPSLMGFIGLTSDYFNEECLKYYDKINLMKGAIACSDAFNTVSGSYAMEIKSEFFGEGLDGFIRKNENKLSGIVNGIDYEVWNPDTDPLIAQNYSMSLLDLKANNKYAIQGRFGLLKCDKPMISIISRLVEMKGLDLVVAVMDEILDEEIQFVILGTGDKKFEDAFRYFASKYPGKLSFRNYYSNEDSHLLYSGSDFLLMPSISEPCGVSQLIAMRYGTIPIVREAGGLKDTVSPFSEFNQNGNGFSFANINAHDMLYTIKQAISYYWSDDIKQIRMNAMSSRNNWKESALKYLELYRG